MALGTVFLAFLPIGCRRFGWSWLVANNGKGSR